MSTSPRHRRRPEPRAADARRQGESARAFEALRAYLKLGPGRTLDEVARGVGKSSAQVRRWSAVHSWVERARRWDDELAELEAAAMRRVAEASAKKWAEREEALRERRYAIAQRMLDRAEQMLKAPLHTQTVRVDLACGPCGWIARTDPGDVDVCPQCGGELTCDTVVEVVPARWTLNTARLFALAASELAGAAIEDGPAAGEALENGAVYEFIDYDLVVRDGSESR